MWNHVNRQEKTPADIAVTRLENRVNGEIPSQVYQTLAFLSPAYQSRGPLITTLSVERTRYLAPTTIDIDMRNGVEVRSRLLRMRGVAISTQMALLLERHLATHLDRATRSL